MKKKIFSVMSCIVLALILFSCGDAEQNQTDEAEHSLVQIAVTFDGLQEFAKAVGKDHVEIHTVIPDGVEPHDFSPKAQDLESMLTAEVFIYSGLGMEPWVFDALDAVGNDELVVVEASKGIEPIVNHNEEEIAEHGEYDPHIWLSLKNAEMEAETIRDALIQVDPQNKGDYESNCNEFVGQLELLYTEYSKKIQSTEQKSIVTGHAAFAYLCKDFGLEQNSVEGVFAEGEPSARQLTELVNYCKENHVTTIFSEQLASPKISQTLADEVGASVVPIYTMGSNEDGLSYLERMSYNMEKIYESLK